MKIISLEKDQTTTKIYKTNTIIAYHQPSHSNHKYPIIYQPIFITL